MENNKVTNHSINPIDPDNLPFIVVEAYKTIRTNIFFALAQNEKKIITVSSSVPGEGKSSCALNLSISFSQLNEKVLLIDADLRKPTIYRKLNLENQKGLSTVLAGFSTVSDSVISINDYLDVLPSGPIPPNPAELLSSPNMVTLLNSLSKIYKYIVIDTPPINVVTDAVIVAKNTSGLVLIAKHNTTTFDEFDKTIESIDNLKVKLLGVVLNDSLSNSQRYYKHSYYGGYRS
mgnify:CR=1 FL=1